MSRRPAILGLTLCLYACGDKPDDTAISAVDGDGDGYLVEDGDCDDGNASVHPGASEVCNGVDDDCDGETDKDASDAPEWYADVDGDGWGNMLSMDAACEAPTGFVEDGTDCDDDDAAVHPGASEVCNGVDDDCDGATDEDDAQGALTWYQDLDDDGYGNAEAALSACTVPSGYVADGTDCDDTDATIYPGAFERCDGLDNDCDSSTPEDEQDSDGDGVMTCAGDCDDGDAASDTDCFACTTYVPHDHPTIQGAIDVAVQGDVICVDGGTYVETIDFFGKAVHLYGLLGADSTVIDGNGMDSVVKFVSGEAPDSVMEGFTIRGGYGEMGGGVRVEGSSPTLTRIVVSGNETDWWGDGGGIYLYQSSSTLNLIEVSSNIAGPSGNGGGVAVVESDAILSRIRISNNEAEFSSGGYGYGNGGGLYLEESRATLDNVLLWGNIAGSLGGGLYCHGEAIQASNISVIENEAEHGGGIHLWESDSVFQNLIVVANQGSHWYSVATGGGLYIRDSDAVIQNAVVAGNTLSAPMSTSGSGAYLWGSNVDFENTVFAYNASSDPDVTCVGGGVRVSTGAPSFSYCNAWGNEPDDYYGIDDPVGTAGNLAADPEFLDTSAASFLDWDLHLDTSSPLIDAGNPVLVDPDGSASDIGAYGGSSAAGWDLDGDGYIEWWLPGAYNAATSTGMDCDDQDATVGPASGC